MDTAPAALVVACHLRWVADDMRTGTAGRWPVVVEPSQALLPDLPDGDLAWWVTTGHAARLVAAGVDLQLDCVDRRWMSDLPARLTGRHITTTTLQTLADQPDTGAGFLKPALAKVDRVPAAWTEDLRRTAQQAIVDGTHPDTAIQWTATRLDLAVEHRVYVMDGTAITSSPYLIDGAAWEPTWDATTVPGTTDVRRFAEQVADSVDCPRSFVVDIGQTTDGTLLVVEANAPWSANPYGCDLAAVTDAVVVATCRRPRSPWTWAPDPHETMVAQRLPRLR